MPSLRGGGINSPGTPGRLKSIAVGGSDSGVAVGEYPFLSHRNDGVFGSSIPFLSHLRSGTGSERFRVNLPNIYANTDFMVSANSYHALRYVATAAPPMLDCIYIAKYLGYLSASYSYVGGLLSYESVVRKLRAIRDASSTGYANARPSFMTDGPLSPHDVWLTPATYVSTSGTAWYASASYTTFSGEYITHASSTADWRYVHYRGRFAHSYWGALSVCAAVKFDGVTGCTCGVGLSDTASTVADVESIYAGVDPTDVTKMNFITSDAGGSTPTTGIAVNLTDGDYHTVSVVIWNDAGTMTATLYVDGTQRAEHTTNVPGSATPLCPKARVMGTALSDTATLTLAIMGIMPGVRYYE